METGDAAPVSFMIGARKELTAANSSTLKKQADLMGSKVRLKSRMKNKTIITNQEFKGACYQGVDGKFF